MNDINNDKYVQACNEIFNIYSEKISNVLKDQKAQLKVAEENVKKEQNRINSSDDFCLKVKYALANLGKLFAVTVLGVDSGYVPFDTYKYYKIQKTGIVDGKGSVQLDYLNNIYNTGVDIVNFFEKFYDTFSLIKNKIISSPELASDFFFRYANKEEDTNLFYRLFEVLDEMEFDIKEVYDWAKRGRINNVKSKNFPAVDKINAIVRKYNIDNNKSLKR